MTSFDGNIAVATATAAVLGLVPTGVAHASIIQAVPPVMAKQTTAAQSAPKKLPPQIELWPEASKRLAYLSTLGEDHDGEGARAPVAESISTCLMFVRQLPYYSPDPLVGLNSEGNAVIEFHDDGELGQVTFLSDRQAEVYFARDGEEGVWFEGNIDDHTFTAKFLRTFGFRFVA